MWQSGSGIPIHVDLAAARCAADRAGTLADPGPAASPIDPTRR